MSLIGIAALLAAPAYAERRGFDGHSPQLAVSSGKTRGALQSCITSRLARFGPSAATNERTRLVLIYEQATPPVTIVINDLGIETRSIEAWRTGPLDKQLRRDTLACI